MYPTIFKYKVETWDIGWIDLPSYFVMVTLGFSFAILLGRREAQRSGLNGEVFLDLGLSMVIFGLIGARILHVLADGFFWDYVNLCIDPTQVPGKEVEGGCTSDSQCHPWEVCDLASGRCHPKDRDCLAALKFWRGGLTFYGGLILGSLYAIWFLRRLNLPFWRYADITGWGIPLGLFFGRIGCFLNGCCFGSRTDSFLGVSFPSWSPASRRHYELGLIAKESLDSLSVHPAQLYSAFLNFLIFTFLYFYLRPRKKFSGEIILTFAICYAIGRFIVEFFRDDQRGGLFNQLLSTSQFISILALLIIIPIYIYLKKRAAKTKS
jgi:phosphatidylglycerol:prolipoprotein diacylglycerol transferase